jgi:hypothetical protein
MRADRQLRRGHHVSPQPGRYAVVGRAPQVINHVSREPILPRRREVWVGRMPVRAPLPPYRLASFCAVFLARGCRFRACSPHTLDA